MSRLSPRSVTKSRVEHAKAGFGVFRLGVFSVQQEVAAFFAFAGAVGFLAVAFFELGKVLQGQRRSFAKLRHVGPQVVDPSLFRIAGFRFASGEEQHVGLHALSVENPGRQSQDRMQVALVHQVSTDLGADAFFKQNVVRQNDGSSATGFESAINVLQESQLLVACHEGKVIASRTTATAFGAKRRIGQHDICFGKVLPVSPMLSPAT